VSTSGDGLQWEPEQSSTERPPETGRDAAQATLRVRFPPRPCRYVRLEFERRGWLMLDEVEVYGPSPQRGESLPSQNATLQWHGTPVSAALRPFCSCLEVRGGR